GSSPVVSTLLLVVGILLLVAAVRKWRKDEDPDDPPPQWVQSIEKVSPVKALGLGALLVAIGPKLWVFTLLALAVVSAAEMGQVRNIAAYIGFIILAQIALIPAVLVYALAPQAAGAILRRALGWLTQYNRPISLVVPRVFGLYFTWNGIKGLLT
ncbi:MAG: GAP family protein, partial [Caulobacteraceae bacterium]|nr:GAP family protein [Caulobacteraceae bacterium]